MTTDRLIEVIVDIIQAGSYGYTATSNLIRLVHGDARVPASVRDDDILAALTVGATKGFFTLHEEHPVLTGYGLQVPHVELTERSWSSWNRRW